MVPVPQPTPVILAGVAVDPKIWGYLSSKKQTNTDHKMAEPSRKRRIAGDAVVPGGAPSWLKARAAQYNQRFPRSRYYDVPMLRGSQESLDLVGPNWKTANPSQRLMRKTYMMTGKGKYKGRGGYFGRALGNLFGMGDLGDKLGDAAWDAGKSLLPGIAQNVGNAVFGVTDKIGKGLYKGRGNYVTNGLIQSANVVPQFGQEDMKTTTITNREYICDVYAPAAGASFTPSEYPLNPGMSKLFAWLSQIAINYEEYAIKQLIVTYKSTVADFASASGQVGQVIMATQYNPTADPFGSKEEMMLYEGGMSCKTTEHMQHGIECDPAKLAGAEYKFIRAGNLPISEDLKEYDLGRLCLAITGTPATYAGQIIGELWVSYTVVLRKPKVASGHAYNIKREVACLKPDVFLPIYASSKYNLGNWQNLLVGTRNTGICKFTVPKTYLTIASLFGDDLLAAQPTAIIDAENTVQQLQLTFADEFEGCVEINFKKFQYAALSDTNMPTRYIKVVSSDQVGPGLPSTILRFADIPAAHTTNFGAKLWTHVHSTTDSFPMQGPDAESAQLANSFHSTEFVMHLRLLPPTSGKKNVITIGFLAEPSTVSYWRCEVNQYNSFLSATDNGRGSAALLLQDINSNPVVWA